MKDIEIRKGTLYTTFIVDSFVAHKQFTERWLCLGASVDIFLSEMEIWSSFFVILNNWIEPSQN